MFELKCISRILFKKQILELFRSIDSRYAHVSIDSRYAHVYVAGGTEGFTLIIQLRTMFALLFSGIETRDERELKLNP